MNITEIRLRLIEKLDKLSSEQLNSLWLFVESLEMESSAYLTNSRIDAIMKSYRQENKKRPIGLCKGEFIVPDDFNDPLPDDILETFYS